MIITSSRRCIDGGGAYLFQVDPSDLKRWATQGGIELQTPWRFWKDSTRLVAALDLQNRQENKWSTENSVRGGLQFERPLSFARKISLLLEYYKGHSPNGQFFNRKVEYFGPGLHLDFQCLSMPGFGATAAPALPRKGSAAMR